MRSPKSEENYPLLLLVLEDGQRSSERKRGFFGGNNRYTRISEGASNVFTQWPAHVSTCWLSTIFFIILFFVITLLLLAAFVHQPHLRPKCTPYNLNDENLKVYLIHCSENWSKSEIEGVKVILQNYPQVKIDIIELTNSTFKRQPRKRSRRLDITIGKNKVINAIKHNPLIRKTNELEQLVKAHRDIITVVNKSTTDYFSFTPLYSAWRRLSPDLVEFAARAIMLWEYGGISFQLPKITAWRSGTNRFNASSDEEWKIEAFLKSNLTTYENLPKEVVNIDSEGLHMETKTPCHAYFGELLMKLRRADGNSTVADLVASTLKIFCRSGAVSDDFCLNLTN